VFSLYKSSGSSFLKYITFLKIFIIIFFCKALYFCDGGCCSVTRPAILGHFRQGGGI
jgi:hypothetical protein